MDAGRLIIHSAARGSWNMAVDEALLESASTSKQSTLRFYRWSEPTLSLGYFQSIVDRQQHPSSMSCAVVRRSTGGGAILHDVELTYSFTSPIVDRLDASVHRFYRAFHETLVDVLASNLGVTAALWNAPTKTGSTRFLCFQRRSDGDVLIQQQKIAGSAQRRRHNALLQHGSILVGRSSFAPELPGIGELSAIPVQPEELVTPWVRALRDRLGIDWRSGQLEEVESQNAREIETARYANEDWTRRR